MAQAYFNVGKTAHYIDQTSMLQKQLSEKINILSDMDFNNLKMQEELEQLSRKVVQICSDTIF